MSEIAEYPPPTEEEQRAALRRLSLVLLAGTLAAIVSGTVRTVAVVLALIAMVMLHELGHYLTGKWSGMKVTEFFLGFGPRLWSVRRGETEYGVKAIPAGGYVKIVGMNNLEEVEPEDEPRTYRQQSYPRRLAVGLAGSAMHFVIAFILLWTVTAVVGVPRPTLAIGGISRLTSGPSPAEEAGFRLGDRIVSVDGTKFAEWDDLPAYIRARPGRQLRFVLERDGSVIELAATPADLSKVEVEGLARATEPVGFIGITPQWVSERENPFLAVGKAAWRTGDGILEVGQVLGRVFTPDGVGRYVSGLSEAPSDPDADDVRFLSPVGFTRLASQAADTGIFEVLQLLILINLFVGVFNLLPLLPLDGGHVAIATYEAIRSRIERRRYQADVARLLPVTYAVFLLIVFLGATSLYLDIVRPLSNPFQ